jgi:hypothetical protein
MRIGIGYLSQEPKSFSPVMVDFDLSFAEVAVARLKGTNTVKEPKLGRWKQ